jgi:hypothetical protein
VRRSAVRRENGGHGGGQYLEPSPFRDHSRYARNWLQWFERCQILPARIKSTANGSLASIR